MIEAELHVRKSLYADMAASSILVQVDLVAEADERVVRRMCGASIIRLHENRENKSKSVTGRGAVLSLREFRTSAVRERRDR